MNFTSEEMAVINDCLNRLGTSLRSELAPIVKPDAMLMVKVYNKLGQLEFYMNTEKLGWTNTMFVDALWLLSDFGKSLAATATQFYKMSKLYYLDPEVTVWYTPVRGQLHIPLFLLEDCQKIDLPIKVIQRREF